MVSTQADPTNATITWYPATEYLYGAWANITFGNTTAYPFYAANNSFGSGGSGSGVFINFLQPSMTYYYKIVAWGYCIASPYHYYHQTYTGNWTTGSDGTSSLAGTVTSGTGSVFSRGGLLVTAYCIDLPSGADSAPTQGVTGSSGKYDISIPGYYGSNGYVECTTLPIHLILSNDATEYENEGDWYWSNQWIGYWNETIIIWSPQVVNFVLPSNYLSNYLPDFIDTSDVPGSGYTALTVANGTGYDNSYTYDWSAGAEVAGLGGGASGSYTSSMNIGETQSLFNTEGTLCWAAKYDVSGTIGFNAVSRQWSFGQSLFDQQDAGYCNQIGGFHIPTLIQNDTTQGAYYMPGPAGSNWSSGLHDFPLREGNGYGYSITLSSSNSITTGAGIGLQLSATLDGVLPLSFQASEGWSQTATTSTSTTLAFSLSGPGSGVSCYNVFGEGGSGSQKTADVVAIYYWQGSLVDGVPYCG